jgi:hypothetical protein
MEEKSRGRSRSIGGMTVLSNMGLTWEAAHRLSDPVAVPGLTVTDDYQTQGLSL